MSILRGDEWAMRYRVVDLSSISDDGSTAFSRETREFRSLDRANACKERWVNEGRVVVLQRGIIRWMPDEEVVSEMHRLTKEGSFVT